jgi:4-hydroxy-tetrahydrodipicolinate synthase
MKKQIRGNIVALVTPFKDKKIDETALRNLVNFHIENGTNGILPCGTTGESPTLSHQEHDDVIRIVVEESAGRIPVMAGTGSNSTAEAIEMTQHAEEIGADAILSVCPYYNKPTQMGLYEHFTSIAESTSLPIILYSIKGRTGINMEPGTVLNLSQTENIVGIKEASGDLGQMSEIISITPEDFLLFSGDDGLNLPVLSLGGAGVISVLSNIIPNEVSRLIDLVSANDLGSARDLHYRMLNLSKVMFCETNPSPIKEAMFKMGMCERDVRLPLCHISDDNRKTLVNELIRFGLI